MSGAPVRPVFIRAVLRGCGPAVGRSPDAHSPARLRRTKTGRTGAAEVVGREEGQKIKRTKLFRIGWDRVL